MIVWTLILMIIKITFPITFNTANGEVIKRLKKP